jgi:hypothetical protein
MTKLLTKLPNYARLILTLSEGREDGTKEN